jgi:hypothetical protein
VTQINHLIQTRAKEVIGGHRQQFSISQELLLIELDVGRSEHPNSPESRYGTTGCGFCRDGYVLVPQGGGTPMCAK